MLLASINAVEKVYGDQVVLEKATLELRANSRTALIGRNGSGKTTILNLLMGVEAPDAGTVHRAQGVTLALLDQDPVFTPGESVVQVAERAFQELDELEERLNALERAGLDDPETYQRWDVLHQTFERRGGYARRARRDAVLDALGFAGRHQQAVQQLSGGERTRLGLARLLMGQPDVLLLDEPTNHLDLEMRAWLEAYLSRYPGAALIVSHDRAFLDGACSRTAEVSRGELRVGDGNPTAYRAARVEAERIQAATRANQEREHARLDAAAAQMKRWAGQSEKLHRRAKAMERRADRYAGQMVDELQGPEGNTRFRFDCDESGSIVLTGRHLSKRFERQLFENITVEVRQGDRIALVGPNGAGKTTFLRLLLGDQASDDPRTGVATGSRVRLGYYDQELRGVDPDATLFEELLRRVSNVEAHNLLGRFMFPYQAQFKKIRDLSGGERARLSLLNLTLGRYNLLILDEPTNHLDVEMIEALEAALKVYRGTLLLVSHDRRFLGELATRVWEVRDGSFIEYEGDFEFYQRKRAERRVVPTRSAASAAPPKAVQNGLPGLSGTPGGAGTTGGSQAAGTSGRTAGTSGTAGASEAAEAAGAPAKAAAEVPGRPRGTDPYAAMSRWQLVRRQEYLEARIAELEAELTRLAKGLEDPDEAVRLIDPELTQPDAPPPSIAEVLAALGHEHANLDQLLAERLEEWTAISERLGAA